MLFWRSEVSTEAASTQQLLGAQELIDLDVEQWQHVELQHFVGPVGCQVLSLVVSSCGPLGYFSLFPVQKNC